MESCKSSKAEVQRVLANLFRNAPGNIQSKQTNDRGREEEHEEERKTGKPSRRDDEESLRDIE